MSKGDVFCHCDKSFINPPFCPCDVELDRLRAEADALRKERDEARIWAAKYAKERDDGRSKVERLKAERNSIIGRHMSDGAHFKCHGILALFKNEVAALQSRVKELEAEPCKYGHLQAAAESRLSKALTVIEAAEKAMMNVRSALNATYSGLPESVYLEANVDAKARIEVGLSALREFKEAA